MIETNVRYEVLANDVYSKDQISLKLKFENPGSVSAQQVNIRSRLIHSIGLRFVKSNPQGIYNCFNHIIYGHFITDCVSLVTDTRSVDSR